METETRAHIKMGHKSTRKKEEILDYMTIETAIDEHL